MSDQLEKAIATSLNNYIELLEGDEPSNLYSLIMRQTEKTLVKQILTRTDNNFSKTARWLGISRNTLKKIHK